MDNERNFVGLDERRWWVSTLWEAARGLPVTSLSVSGVREFDEDCCFSGDGRTPTVRAVADHARRIYEVDLTDPVLLAADGQVLDGMRRIAKAYITGLDELPAKRFGIDPKPDWLVG